MGWFEFWIITLPLVAILLLVFILYLVYEGDTDRHNIKTDIVELRSEVLAVKESSVRVEGFTAKLDASPQFRGVLGEQIVEQLLDSLPKGSYEKQVLHPKIQGRPDFVVSMPSSELLLAIDAKTVQLTSDTNLPSLLRMKSTAVAKYITPGVTFDFALMWLSEPAYYEMDQKTYMDMFSMGVIPVTTTNLMSVVFLIRRAYKVFELNEKASEFLEFKENIAKQVGLVRENFFKASKQISNATSNMSNVDYWLGEIERLAK